MPNKVKSPARILAELCAKVADEMKGEEITILEVSTLTTVADYFVVCAGNSAPHLNAISDNAFDRIKKELGKRPIMSSGGPESGWMVLDYGSVIFHIFSKPARQKYSLESLWNDAPKIEKKCTPKRRLPTKPRS
ncbi:MAG TPA: ribosome silencing factor [Victivallales bacterium]|nr:ribosome silencing factor [Victivallales bacterium]